MRKAMLIVPVTALSLIVIETSAQAEAITYNCGGAILHIDTKSRAISLTDDEGKRWMGHAETIDNTKIVYGLQGTAERWSIDRRTGVGTSLAGGETDQCTLVK